ncbi:MAG: class II aldolase/adducin family protein, partial [Candidatus Margulisiibacteriota bacterium]
MKIEEFRKIGRLLFQQGLVDSHSGNLSIRDGDKIYITKRDSMLGELDDESIVEVGLASGGSEDLASRELPVHRAIYKETGALAIVHAHPISAIAISLTDNKIVPQDAEGLYVYKSASIVRVHN